MITKPAADEGEAEGARQALLRRWPRRRAWLETDDAIPRHYPLLKRVPRTPTGRRSRARLVWLHLPGAPFSSSPTLDRSFLIAPASESSDEVEVAHEALIRHWPRLQEWLDQDRTALLLRESVREAAQEWERNGREESYLVHRGRRLEAADALRLHPRLELNALERAYLDAAVALREQEEQAREAQRQRELDAERERAELAEQRTREQAKATRHFRIVAGVAAAAAVAALLFGVVARDREAEATRQRAAADVAAATAAAEARGAKIAQMQSLAREASLQHELGRDELGALVARQAYLTMSSESLAGPIRGPIDEALHASLAIDHFGLSLRGGGDIASLAFGPGGTTLAASGQDGFRLWNFSHPGAPPTEFVDQDIATGVLYADGESFVTIGEDGTVLRVDPAEPDSEPVVVAIPPSGITPVAISPDGRTLAQVTDACPISRRICDQNEVQLYAMEQVTTTPVAVDRFAGEDGIVVFSPDGTTLAEAGIGVRIWNWATGQPSEILPGSEEVVFSALAFDSSGTMLAAGANGTVLTWDLSDPTSPSHLTGQIGGVTAIAVGPENAWLATGGGDGNVRLWTMGDLEAPPAVMSGHDGPVSALAFDPVGRRLASGSTDGVRLWDLLPSAAVPLVLGQLQDQWAVDAVAFATTPGARLLVEGKSDEIRVWDLGGAEDRLLELPSYELTAPFNVEGVALSPDRRWLVATDRSSAEDVALWDLASPEPAPVLLSKGDMQIGAIAFDPNGRTLALAGCWELDVERNCTKGGVRLVDPENPKADPLILTGNQEIGLSLAFTPDGKVLAAGGRDGAVWVWDRSDSGANPVVLASDEGWIVSLAFRSDGQALVVGSLNWAQGMLTIFQWNLSHPPADPVITTSVHAESPYLFSPDGWSLASGSATDTVQLWDASGLAGGATTLRPPELAESTDIEQRAFLSLAFSSDGFVAGGREDGAVFVWIADPSILAELVCQRVWRNLTMDEWQQFVGPDLPYERTCPNLPTGDGVPAADDAAATPVPISQVPSIRSAGALLSRASVKTGHGTMHRVAA